MWFCSNPESFWIDYGNAETRPPRTRVYKPDFSFISGIGFFYGFIQEEFFQNGRQTGFSE